MFFQLTRIRLGGLGERVYVPEQGQDGQKREFAVANPSRGTSVVSRDRGSSDAGKTGVCKRSDPCPLGILSLGDRFWSTAWPYGLLPNT